MWPVDPTATPVSGSKPIRTEPLSAQVLPVPKEDDRGFDDPDEHVAPERPIHLRLENVRAVFRLINEIRELGIDPQKWRPHMVRRMRGLLGAISLCHLKSTSERFRQPA